MKKTIINEEALRIFVRSQIRKELNKKILKEQGKIQVSQGTAVTDYTGISVDKCEFKLPPEFKRLYDEIKKGRVERAKIIMFRRMAGVGLGTEEARKLAAKKKGVIGPGKKIRAGVEEQGMLPPQGFGFPERLENDALRLVMDLFPAGQGSLPFAGEGIMFADYPFVVEAGAYGQRAAEAIAFAYKKHISKGLGEEAATAAGNKAVKEVGEFFDNYFKDHVTVYDKEKGTSEQVKVSADLQYQYLEERYGEQYENIFKLIEGATDLLSKVATYSGAPSFFCRMLEKAIKYLSKMLDYAYDPVESRQYREIADGRGKDTNAPRIRPSGHKNTEGFDIEDELDDHMDEVLASIGTSEMKQVSNYRDNDKLKSAAYFFEKFYTLVIAERADLPAKKSELISKLRENINDIKNQHDSLASFSPPADKIDAYEKGIDKIKVKRKTTEKRAAINRSDPAKIKSGMLFDYKGYARAAGKILKRDALSSSSPLNFMSSDIVNAIDSVLSRL